MTLAASAEWQRPIVLAGNRKDWEHTVFLDAGSVTDEPGNNVQIFVGAGSGIRWNSPVGPLQADIAYGFKTQTTAPAPALRLYLLNLPCLNAKTPCSTPRREPGCPCCPQAPP